MIGWVMSQVWPVITIARPQIAGSEAWAFLCSLWAFVREKATDVQRLWAAAQWRVRFSVVLLV